MDPHDLHIMKYKITDHNRSRVDSLAHQLEHVNQEVRDVINEITTGVDSAKEMETIIREKESFMNKHLEAAVLIMHDANKKIKDLKEQDISVLSLYENPPKGLEPLIRCFVYILASIVPEDIIKADIVNRPMSIDWKTCRHLLRNGKEFIEGLHQIRGKIDKSMMSHESMEYAKFIFAKSYLEFEDLKAISKAVVDLHSFLQSVISYYDVIFLVKESESDMAKTTTRLETTTKRLVEAEEEMNKLKQTSDEIYKELNLATSKP